MRSFFAIFFVLHGLVHLLYFAQSRRIFELQPDLVWPDGSWAFSKLLGNETTRRLACLMCILAAFGMIVGGIGVFLEQDWWHPMVVSAAGLSAAGYILFWNGKIQELSNQGAIGLLIDLALLALLLTFNFDF
jgi:hypothetical protein